MMLALSIINVCAVISTVGLCLSPFPDFRRIHVQQNTGEVRILPVLMLLCNCFLWALYGYLTVQYFPVMAINVFGTITSAVFSSVFYYWSSDRSTLHKMIACATFGLLIVVGFVVLVKADAIPIASDKLEKVIGFVCIAINICLYASPLQTTKIVLATKSAASLPLTMCAVNLINGSLWVAYSILSSDMFILGPNSLGVLLSAIQVALCIKYRARHVIDEPEDEATRTKSHISLSISPINDGVAIEVGKTSLYEFAETPCAPRAS